MRRNRLDYLWAALLLTVIVAVYLVFSFFLSARQNGTPILQMFSPENIESSLKWDIPVIICVFALTGVVMFFRDR